MTKSKIKILIIGDVYPVTWKDLYISAAIAAGHEAEFIDVSTIRIDIEREVTNIFIEEHSIYQFSHIIFLSEVYERLYFYICYLLKDSGIKILNSKSILKYPLLSDKFLQALINSKNHITMPKSSYTLNPSLIDSKYDYPMVVKTLGASHSSHSGRGVIKVYTKKHLEYTYATNIEGALKAQEFIPRDPVFDFRTIMLNGKSLGTIKRIPQDGEFRTNGAKERIIVPDNPKHIMVLKQLSKDIDCEFFAPDYMIRDEEMIIFEINRFPSFSVTESKMPIKIIYYMAKL